MKNTVVYSVVFCCCLSTCLAASAFGPATVHDSHPNECYSKESESYHKPGDTWQYEGCGQASCMMLNFTGNSQLMVSYESCGVVEVGAPCYLGEDLSLPYPDCCPQPMCPEDEGQAYENEVEDDNSENSRQDRNYNQKGQQYDNFLYQDQDQEQINPEKYQTLEFYDRNVRQFSPRFQYSDTNENEYNDYQYQWF